MAQIKIRRKVIFVLLVCLVLVGGNILFPDYYTTVYTPNGTAVSAIVRDEMTAIDIAYWNGYVDGGYPNAVRLSNATSTYNCHAYAWHITEGGNTVWINDPSSYWLDGSYVETTESEATKVSYSGDHSAVTTSTTGWYISKWGSLPLMRHYKTDCPTGYGSPSKFYKKYSPPVDLYFTDSPISLFVVEPGDSFTVSCEVGGYSTQSSTLKYYLSSDTNLDTAVDTYLGSDYVGPVSASSPSPESGTFILDASTPDGDYYIILHADANNQVTEVNESNNIEARLFCVYTPPAPADLVIYNNSTSPRIPQGGDLIQINCTVKNIGGTSAGSSTVKFYATTDATLGTYLGSQSIGSLAAGAVSAEVSVQYQLPPVIPASLRIVMVADANNQVSEENETNNTSYVPFLIPAFK